MTQMQTAIPAQKVTAAVAAVALAHIGIYAFEQLAEHDLPALVEGAVATVTVGLVGYLVPPASRDNVIET